MTATLTRPHPAVEYVVVREAAARLGLYFKTVQSYCRDGVLHAHGTRDSRGKEWRIRPEVLEVYERGGDVSEQVRACGCRRSGTVDLARAPRRRHRH